MTVQAVAAPDPHAAQTILAEMAPVTPTDLIPLLQRLREAYGCMPRDVVLDVRERTGLPASRMCRVPRSGADPAAGRGQRANGRGTACERTAR